MYRGGPEEQRTALQQGLEVGGQAQLLTSTLLSASSSFLPYLIVISGYWQSSVGVTPPELWRELDWPRCESQ